MSDPVTGDSYARREVRPGVYQCGCHWRRDPNWGDVLVECVFHAECTKASVDKHEAEIAARKALGEEG